MFPKGPSLQSTGETYVTESFPGAATLLYCVNGVSVGYFVVAAVCLILLMIVSTVHPSDKSAHRTKGHAMQDHVKSVENVKNLYSQ